MKIRFQILFFALAVIVFSSCGKDKTPEGFGEEILSYFTDNNPTAYKKSFITRNEIFQVIDQSKLSNADRKEAKRKLRLRSSVWKSTSKVAFDAIRFHAYELGVKWDDITVKKKVATPSGLRLLGLESYFTKDNGMNIVDIRIYFTSADENYIFELEDCIETSNGWKMTRNAEIKRDYSAEE